MPIPDQLDIKSRLILVAIGPVFSVRQRASCRLGSGPFLVASSLIIKSIPLHPISSQITFARDNLVSDHFDFVSKAMAPCSKLSQTSPMVSQNWRLCVRTSSASSTSSGHCTCHHQWGSDHRAEPHTCIFLPCALDAVSSIDLVIVNIQRRPGWPVATCRLSPVPCQRPCMGTGGLQAATGRRRRGLAAWRSIQFRRGRLCYSRRWSTRRTSTRALNLVPGAGGGTIVPELNN